MINIAIDGPAGAGKSTIAKAVARKLGYIYVDTGALYRAIGLYVIRNGKNTTLEDDVTPLLSGLDISLRYVEGEQQVFLFDENVSGLIRTQEVSMAASDVSAHSSVRHFLFQLQRDIAEKNNCVMDGRDIGTVVLPGARAKLFLTASAQVRAQRRYKELLDKGVEESFGNVLAEIEKRDYQDTNRAVAPLRAAEDAITLDTSDMPLAVAIDTAERLIMERI